MPRSKNPVKVKPADVKYDHSPDYVTFVVHTAKYRTLPTKKYLNRKKWEAKDPNKIAAGIPGSIHKIYVKEGDKVKKGAVLMELEAMKMFNKILAPYDAIVKQIFTKEKDKVSKNFILIELE